MQAGALITADYCALQRALHARPEGYGGKGRRWAGVVAWLANREGAVSVLDYGCGQGTLSLALRQLAPFGLACREYDPAVPGKDAAPRSADLVVCTDVLEHVEPDRIDDVLTHIRLLAQKAIFAVVSLRSSNKTMDDGRNAHLIVEVADWWRAKVSACGWQLLDVPDLQLPPKVSREKQWIVVARP